MKKTIALILSLLTFCAFALADGADLTFDDPADADIQSRFSDVWISGDYSMEIWFEDGEFLCSVMLAVNENEGMTWEYGSCETGADANTLVCTDGTKRHDVFDSETFDLLVEDVETGLTCELKLEGDALVWTAPDAEAPVKFICLDAAGLAGLLDDGAVFSMPFEGIWECGDVTLEITQENGAYMCRVAKYADGRFTEWTYMCDYDDEAELLHGTGSKAYVTYGEHGVASSYEEAYRGGEAVFTLVSSDSITWDDMAEGAGNGMVFRPLEDTADEEA